jgi:hypothetical protein
VRLKYAWEDEVTVDPEGTGRVCVNCVYLARDSDLWRAHMSILIYLQVP